MALSHRFVIQDYEERRLESSKWISTTIIGVYQELAKIEGFKLLQSYIQGQNEEGMYTIILQLIRDRFNWFPVIVSIRRSLVPSPR